MFDNFERDLRRRSSKDVVNEEFYFMVEKMFYEAMDYFRMQNQFLIIEGTNWHEQIKIHESDLSQQLNNLINNAREKEIDKLQLLTQVSYDEIMIHCIATCYRFIGNLD